MLDPAGKNEKQSSRFSLIINVILIAFGALISLSWILGLSPAWSDEWHTKLTRPNSAFSFMIAGIALSLFQPDRSGAILKIPLAHLSVSLNRIGQALGSVLVAISGLTLLEDFTGLNLNIDAVLISRNLYGQIDSVSTRMSTLTSIGFFLTGIIFLSFDKKIRRNIYPSEILAIIVLIISLDVLISFLYMSDEIPNIGNDASIPIISSLMFGILSTGILAARQERGLVAVWVARYNGSTLVRKWLPIGILVFVLAGEAVDLLHDFHILRSGVSLSVYTIVVVSFTAVVVFLSAVRLNRAERELLHSNKLYAVLSQSNQTMVRTRDREQLLRSLCDVILRYGEFRTVWISTFHGAGGEISIDACSGDDCEGFVKDAASMHGFSDVTGIRRVLEGEEYHVFNSIESNDLPPETRARMLDRGNQSMSILQLRSFGKIIGIVGVCSDEVGYFNTREIKLLREVAMDLSFALEDLERERQREQAEVALRESEERFRVTFEKAAVGIVLLTPSGAFMKANPRFCEMVDYDNSELVGHTFLELTHPDDRERDLDNLEKMLRGEIATYLTEKRYIKKSGEPIWMNLSAALVRDPVGEPQNLISVVQDISERKKAEELLRRSEEQYQKFFEEDITADFIATVEGKILSCNPAFARIFGFSSIEEALQSNVNDLYPSHEECRDFLQLLRAAKKVEYYETKLRRRDGSEIYVIKSAYGIFDEHGSLIQTKYYLFDDTRRRMLEQQMLQTQKMESLGTLAGGIAHDFNNILGIIMGHTALIRRRDLSEEKFSRSIGAIDSATNRGVGLIRQLLTFARKEERIFKELSVNDLINDIYRLLEETFPRVITIQLELADDLPHIIADPNQIHQALLNLCVNARDAMFDRKDGMPSGGTLTLATTRVGGKTVRTRFPNATKNEYIQVTVSDTGFGMDESIRSHIFEPFFTTKERGKGTGLGLATVYGIVEGHGGLIDVASQPGIGTTFTMYFPSQAAAAHGLTTQSDYIDEIEGGNETILLVEDEEMLADFLKEILTRKGYSVLTALDGEYAVSVFLDNFKNIDLVVSDLGLPKLGGLDMLTRLKKIDPGVRLIFASGFLEPDARSAIFDAGAKEFIQKPYSANEVLRKVREILDK